jgi:hypothetical protein
MCFIWRLQYKPVFDVLLCFVEIKFHEIAGLLKCWFAVNFSKFSDVWVNWMVFVGVFRHFDEDTLAGDSDYYTVGRSISLTRAPVTSVQGSLSSGALTDETFSLTDSSLSLWVHNILFTKIISIISYVYWNRTGRWNLLGVIAEVSGFKLCMQPVVGTDLLCYQLCHEFFLGYYIKQFWLVELFTNICVE